MENGIEIIKTTISKNLPDARIILFGSRAKHASNPDSDYDVLVVSNLPDSKKEQMLFQSIIRKDLAKKTHNIDLLITEASKFDNEFEQYDPGNLTDFSVAVRYPVDYPEVSNDEIEQYIAFVEN